jgi:sporulation protein YlmC with PRC-barrel domain
LKGIDFVKEAALATLDTPTDPTGRLIAASQVSGTSVFDPGGTKLGSVLDVVIDKVSGRVSYAVLSFGGFLGIGDRHHPLPWASLHYDEQLGGYVVNVTRETLEGAPAYDAGESVAWSDASWGKRVDDYYGGDPLAAAVA